jgi:hypothetical protein
MKIGRLFVAAIAVAALCGTGQSAKADSTTFLQFFQFSSSAKPFSITYGAGGSIDSAASGVPVIVNVDPVVGGPGIIVGTLLDMHIGFASGGSFGPGGYSQNLGAGVIDISFGAGSVLHVALTSALLDADASTGHSPTVSATVPLDGITYSSTLFPAIGGFNHEQNFSLSFSALNNTPSGFSGGFLTGSAGVMSGSGTFAGAPVPEPGTLTLAFCAIPVLGLISLRRRRAQA